MEQPLYSILTVTFNNSSEIELFLESAAALQGVELYIVDNHSSDDTQQRIHPYLNTLETLHIVDYQGPSSVARAYNYGISQIDSEIIFLVHPTVKLDQKLLYRLLHEIQSSDSVGLVSIMHSSQGHQESSTGCFHRFPGYKEALLYSFQNSENWFQDVRIYSHKAGKINTEVQWCNSPLMCIQKSLFEKVGYFDESFPRDLYQLDWFYRLSETEINKPVHVLFDQVNFIKQDRVINGLMHQISKHIGLFRFFEKHHDNVYHQFMNLILGSFLYLLLPVKLVIRIIKSKIL